MRYVTDRVPGEGKANTYKLTKSDGSSEEVKIERADHPVNEGTDVNRDLLMAMQGFDAFEVVFGDGIITETNSQGDILVTSFPEGDIAKQTFTQTSTGQSISVRTYEENGKIKGVVE